MWPSSLSELPFNFGVVSFQREGGRKERRKEGREASVKGSYRQAWWVLICLKMGGAPAELPTLGGVGGGMG